jgi:hypothetical protein
VSGSRRSFGEVVDEDHTDEEELARASRGA